MVPDPKGRNPIRLPLQPYMEIEKDKKKLMICCIQVNPLHLRSDTEIRDKLKKIEGVAAPLGDSSENSPLLQKLLYEKYQVTVYLEGEG